MGSRQTNHNERQTQVTESERVEACCTFAREKLEVGDYDGGVAALSPWWQIGKWPLHANLNNKAAAELLLTTGMLSGVISSTKQVVGGQKPAEALLNGSIALFEQMGAKSRASEAR